MLTTKKTCCACGPTRSSCTVICSSSPSPSPVRLSPLCCRPAASRLPKKTASRLLPDLSKSTADTSRSTSPFRVSQPRPAVMHFMAELWGRSTTLPFCMAKATFSLFGALGITSRMRPPSAGSRMSMKCWPSCAGTSTSRSSQSEPDFTIMPTTSTSSSLSSMENFATSFSLRSSRTWIMPFFTSLRWPPLKAATTKMIICTFSGILLNMTQIISSNPLFSPVVSSPECVTHLRAFRLL
mmetsp:Transcript_17637/g.54551  ORF Transcript_17637/g.54551 Transcript_17637/m.54551 type:complete len:239 (-) Transcript_17637:203-919(-)